jgi:hypothetical protein
MTLILDAPQLNTKYKPNAKKKAGEACREKVGRVVESVPEWRVK